MTLLIITFLFGVLLSYFSAQNTNLVTIQIAGVTFQAIPLYMVVVGSVLVGLFMSWVVHIINSVFSSMELHGKNSALRKSQDTIARLEEKVRALELEKAHLRGESTEPIVVEKEEYSERPSVFSQLRHRFSL